MSSHLNKLQVREVADQDLASKEGGRSCGSLREWGKGGGAERGPALEAAPGNRLWGGDADRVPLPQFPHISVL